MKINAKSPLSFFIIITAAILLVIILIKSQSGVQRDVDSVAIKVVDIVIIKTSSFQPHVTGYGNVKPAITFNSMSEVSGKVAYVHPNLKSGETIDAGTVVVKIEAKDYALNVKQSQADLRATRSVLNELNEEEKTTKRTLTLAKKNLTVSEQEYARIQELHEKRVISKSTLDAEERSVNTQRQLLEEMQGHINAFESRKQSLNAQIIRAEREVENQQTILSRTEITLPFEARIGEVSIEENEFVKVGTELFEAIDLQGVEITAQLPLGEMRKLITHLRQGSQTEIQTFPKGQSITDKLNLKARVSLVGELSSASWEAKVLRINDAIDTTRQTLGIVVAVEKPYEKAIIGQRPPLFKGLYTSIDVYGKEREAIVIPLKSMHQGRVYLINDEGQLEIRPVVIEQIQGEIAVIESGLVEGERLIVTDLFPVIEGMQLRENKVEAILESDPKPSPLKGDK